MTNAGAVGLIGLGETGQVHAAESACAQRGWRRWPTPRRNGSSRSWPRACRPPDDAGDVIADPRVGIVSVCLPHHLYFPVALAAIRAGRTCWWKSRWRSAGAVRGTRRGRRGGGRDPRGVP